MKRLPIVPTILVGLAIAAMIGLGVWQLQRLGEKNALLASHRAAENRPEIAWPATPDRSLLFRRARGFCLAPVAWRAESGRNRAGESGWSHIASCRTGGAEGPGMQVDMGWSRGMDAPEGWRGGEVAGVIVPDSDHIIQLVSAEAAPGLEPSAPPTPDDIPNNHLAYAIQWFAFAAIALVIYGLALWRRSPGR